MKKYIAPIAKSIQFDTESTMLTGSNGTLTLSNEGGSGATSEEVGTGAILSNHRGIWDEGE